MVGRLNIHLLLGSFVWAACWLGCAAELPSPLEVARSHYQNGQWELAAGECSQLLSVRPSDTEALKLRGQCYVAGQRYDEAIADFSLLIERTPESPEAYYLRQMAYERGGYAELAQADASYGRSIDPAYKTAYLFDPSNFSQGIREDVFDVVNGKPPEQVVGDDEESATTLHREASGTTNESGQFAGDEQLQQPEFDLLGRGVDDENLETATAGQGPAVGPLASQSQTDEASPGSNAEHLSGTLQQLEKLRRSEAVSSSAKHQQGPGQQQPRAYQHWHQQGQAVLRNAEKMAGDRKRAAGRTATAEGNQAADAKGTGDTRLG